MENDKETDWGFNPSNDHEFKKNIEMVLQEETEQEKIDTDMNDGIQIIDTSTKEEKNDDKDIFMNESDIQVQEDPSKVEENIQSEEFDSDDLTVLDEVASTQDNDDFAAMEDAIHRQAESELEEKSEDTMDEDEDMVVADITRSLASQLEDNDAFHENTELDQTPKKRSLIFRIGIPAACVLVTVLFLFAFLRYTTPGRNLTIKVGAWFAAGRTHYDDGSQQQEQIVPDEIEKDPHVIESLPVVDEDKIQQQAGEGVARHEDYAVNILLLGEEAIDSGLSRGRTDVMLILTMNQKDRTIKLTSLMRDMYVQIPGHLDNKLNSAYATGGIPLLYETIELNFDLKLDGYALVGFNDFEKIVDLLDGVDIDLTKTEANWLNNTNYISNPLYRTVTEGTNHMNGNQALGYCRIRSVGTADKQYDDFGRTSRHRILVDKIFEKYKSLGLWDLASVVNSCLPMITTDLDANEIEQYLKIAFDIGLNDLQQYRIPADGTFENATIRKMSVIVPDLNQNVKILHEDIFGTSK